MQTKSPVLKVPQQGVYGFLANLVVIPLLQGIGLVDEQDSTHRAVDDPLGLQGRVADVL